MNRASKYEPFLLSMAKWQINTKLCAFFQTLYLIFCTFTFHAWKYGLLRFQRIIKGIKQTSRSDFLMRLNLSHFSFFAGKWQKNVTYPVLWDTITNEQEEKWASQPHKVDKISQDLYIDIVFRPIWSLFILVKYRTRYRGCWDPRNQPRMQIFN